MNEQLQWQAVQARDAAHDGRFVYGVITTGIYCRPSCAARKPLRDNVRFFPTAIAAEKHGLRPCKRCRPRESPATKATWIESLCHYIEAHSDETLSLRHLAREAGTSPARLQRAFRAAVGITPRAYAEACRLRALKRGLRDAPTVTDAIYEAGFGSSSRVYERAAAHIGMTPGQYRRGGDNLAISYTAFGSPLGLLMMAATDRGLCFIQFGESEAVLLERLTSEFPRARLCPMPASAADGPFADWMAALSDYLRGQSTSLDLPTDVQGTAFQMKVWDYLRQIPRGELRTYKQIAAAVGRPTAVRAVGGAIGANRVGLVIPCHRVIRSGGALGGYRWGTERKRALIALEGAGDRLEDAVDEPLTERPE